MKCGIELCWGIYSICLLPDSLLQWLKHFSRLKDDITEVGTKGQRFEGFNIKSYIRSTVRLTRL